MTERLYYTDSALTEFDATVLALEPFDGRAGVVLDRTAFYPTSGGQPNDTGRLGGCAVLDVIDRDDGTILHILDGDLAVGRTVRGEVDQRRRLDHMQQHTGQHILSAAFERLYRARTVGFHLGADVSTIDLDKELSAEKVVAAERESNRIVWEDRAVSIRFATEEEAAALPLRKDPGRSGPLRIVDVADFDLSACGGTHVGRAGAIGQIAVWSSEKFRGGLRLEFVCGVRALSAYRRLREAVDGCIRFISVPPGELPGAVERIQAEAKDLRKELRGLQDRLAVFEAEAMAARAVERGGRRVLVEALEGWDQNGLKAMALAIVAKPGYAVALLSTSSPAVAVVARSADVALDAGAVLKALLTAHGGRGGGKADLAQGGGLTGETASLLAAARAAMG